MKKLFFILFLFSTIFISAVFADTNVDLRDYDGLEIAKGTFIPVISAQEISTAYFDIGSKVDFISTSDLYLNETNVVPQNSKFLGYIEKLNEPVVGTNASMIIKITKLQLPDGFEIPLKGYIYTSGSVLIGGEITEPASYIKKASYREGFKTMTGYVPGDSRRMGTHKVIASGAELLIILVSPLYITHTMSLRKN
jgi:hypothetical protein